ncbi:hypothetical protein MKX08_000776 [Trichoderma sp. CBMAI-0020]|nr:hypothetical protein MKX08_000776 [Trichoderma sp. CBMAI-0020]
MGEAEEVICAHASPYSRIDVAAASLWSPSWWPGALGFGSWTTSFRPLMLFTVVLPGYKVLPFPKFWSDVDITGRVAVHAWPFRLEAPLSPAAKPELDTRFGELGQAGAVSDSATPQGARA